MQMSTPQITRAQMRRIAREATFSLTVDAPGGGRPLYLNWDEYQAFLADEEGFASRHFGMTVEEYREWVNLEGAVRCTGATVSSKRCRNMSKIQMEAGEWSVKRRSWRCHLHDDT